MTCTFLSVFATGFRNVSRFFNFSYMLFLIPMASCSLIIIDSTLDRPASDIIDANIAPDIGVTPDFNVPALG